MQSNNELETNMNDKYYEFLINAFFGNENDYSFKQVQIVAINQESAIADLEATYGETPWLYQVQILKEI